MILAVNDRRLNLNIKNEIEKGSMNYLRKMDLFMCYNANECIESSMRTPFYAYFISHINSWEKRKNGIHLKIKDFSSAVFTPDEKSVTRNDSGDFEIIIGKNPGIDSNVFKFSSKSRFGWCPNLIPMFSVWPPYPSLMDEDPLYTPNLDRSLKRCVVYATHLYIGMQNIIHGLAEHDFHGECHMLKINKRNWNAPAEN